MNDKFCSECGHSEDVHASDGCFWQPNINYKRCACRKTSYQFRIDAQAAEIATLRAENARLADEVRRMEYKQP